VPILLAARVQPEQGLLSNPQGKAEQPQPSLYAAAQASTEGNENGGSRMKPLTRKEAQKQLEFLMALQRLSRVLDGKAKHPAKVRKTAASVKRAAA
jgi:hypothetical protein